MEKVRAEIERRVAVGAEPPRGHIPFTPRAKKVLELSLREAIRLGHNYIGTEHVLLGLLREGEGVAAQILLTEVDGGLEGIQKALQAVISGLVPEDIRTQLEKLGRGWKGGPLHVTLGEPRAEDETRKRLEAIEARLSVIEQLLRDLRPGREEVS
jgi:ATP-dependent Clp protease ATP-binding subunit ClpC